MEKNKALLKDVENLTNKLHDACAEIMRQNNIGLINIGTDRGNIYATSAFHDYVQKSTIIALTSDGQVGYIDNDDIWWNSFILSNGKYKQLSIDEWEKKRWDNERNLVTRKDETLMPCDVYSQILEKLIAIF
ncbi:MAG: hypothetical protein K2M17_05760 [Bacilli bacterium]|nr:hypothetical protein [Bacilli bacterium]